MSIRHTNEESLNTVSTAVIYDVPNTPSMGTATDVGTNRPYNNGAATVSITQAATGGRPSEYTATSSPGSFTATNSTNPVLVTGLQSNTSYTFTGTVTGGSESTVVAATGTSNSITATTVPQAPTIGAVTAPVGTGTATVAYTAGATGGKSVSAYTATSTPGGLTGTGTSPITVSGLTLGTSYTFAVTATNANGTSLPSASSSAVTPVNNNWIRDVNVSGYTSGNGVATDTSANYFTSFLATIGGSSNQCVTKSSTSGIASWAKSLTTTGTVQSLTSNFDRTICADSSGNSYTVTQHTLTSASALIVKWDSSGNIVWQRRFGGGSGAAELITPNSISVDSSGNVYVTGINNNPTGIVAKYDSSGTLQWQRSVLSANYVTNLGVKADSSGNVYISGYYETPTPQTFYVLTKFNSSGTFQWSKSWALGGHYNLVLDSTGNPITLGYNGNLTKYTTAGAVTWSRQILGNFVGLDIDSSNNLYLLGSNGANTTYVVKYNSSGVLQWQRGLTSTGEIAKSIAIDSAGFIVVGFRPSSGGISTIKLSADGSNTGTFSNNGRSWVIAASSLTDSSSTPTESTAPTSATTTISATTPTYTAADVTLTTDVITYI